MTVFLFHSHARSDHTTNYLVAHLSSDQHILTPRILSNHGLLSAVLSHPHHSSKDATGRTCSIILLRLPSGCLNVPAVIRSTISKTNHLQSHSGKEDFQATSPQQGLGTNNALFFPIPSTSTSFAEPSPTTTTYTSPHRTANSGSLEVSKLLQVTFRQASPSQKLRYIRFSRRYYTRRYFTRFRRVFHPLL